MTPLLRVVAWWLLLLQSARPLTMSSRPSVQQQSRRRRRPSFHQSQDTSRRLVELVEEASRVARETGARATIRRTVEGQRAAVLTFLELSRELPEPPRPTQVAEWIGAATTSSDPSATLLESVSQWAETNVPKELAPKFLRKLFERLGATYVKLGQFVASSPTLFPAEFVREFEKCLDDAPEVPFSEIKATIEQELKAPLSAVFDSFSEEPLASASIAQVHAAVYKGSDVVVKVRKPGVDLLLKADLGFLDIAGKCLEFVAPDLGRLSLANALEDLRVVMLDELDFSKEASNLQRYQKWLTESHFTGVATCPTPFPEVSTGKVLTMTRLRGSSIVTSGDVAEHHGVTPEQLIANALDVWAASVVTGPFFHADVHAANLLALPDGRVGFLDFGIVGKIPSRIFDAVAQAASAAALRDYLMLAEALRNVGASDEDVDVKAFAQDLEKVFAAFDNLQPNVVVAQEQLASGQVASTASLALDETQVADVLLALVATTENYGIKLPREFGLLLKQALYFDKFTKILAPDLDMADTFSRRSSSSSSSGGGLADLPDATVRD